MTAAAHALHARASTLASPRLARSERCHRDLGPARPVILVATVANANDDALLVRALLRRDEAAWRTFRRRFDPLVMRVIAGVGGRRADRSEIEEIHASLLCSLLEHDMRKLRRFDAARGSLEAFLHVLARHAAINHLRSRARARLHTSLDEQTQVLAAPERDPGALLDESHWRSALDASLRSLSERDRAFIELFYVEEQTAEEIARTLKVTVETVYTRKVRIQQRLRKAHARGRG